jgi:hypothetical protein
VTCVVAGPSREATRRRRGKRQRSATPARKQRRGRSTLSGSLPRSVLRR